MRPGERIEVRCVDLDDDGAGLTTPVGVAEGNGADLTPAGAAEGSGAAATARVHVAGALPGERVAAIVAHVSPHAAEAWADLISVETPSPDRRSPICRAFGRCGGCVLQQLAYPAQLDWKRRRVARALAAADPTLADLPVAVCVASPRALGYRNKSKLVPASVAGKLVLGAYAPRTHDIVDLAGCRITETPLDDTAATLREILDQDGVRPFDERTAGGELRHVVLRANRDGRVLAVWVVARPLPGGEALARAFRRARPEVLGVVEHQNRSRGNAIFAAGGEPPDRVLAGDGTFEDRIDVLDRSLRLRLSATAFFQANRDVAALAYDAIARGLAVEPGERVVDLYSGIGAIALTLSPRAGEVIGVETHPGAAADAKASAALNEITNARFVAGDAARALDAIAGADLVVVNPPRKGVAGDVITALARLAPRAIAYLSCDPATLARDLVSFAGRGYRVRSVTPFDMLPHTPHVETLALLDRR